MLKLHESSVIGNPNTTLDPVSEHGKDGLMKGVLQRQSKYSKLYQVGLLWFAVLAVLHYVYYGIFPTSTFTNLGGHDQAPALHFSTPTARHTSPIGLFVDDNKIWHIYFQCQSSTLIQKRRVDTSIDTPAPIQVSDRTSWGHATSSNLYAWSIQPIALQDEDHDIWGGSVAIDKNNTSGAFPNQTNGVVAVYTQHHPRTRTIEQAIVFSIDGGYTFAKSPKNQVLRFPEGNQDFWNPKVIWHERTQRWVMTVVKATSTTIGIYTSPNLIDWVTASDFTVHDLVDVGHGFESPSLVPIPRLNSTGAKVPNLPTGPGGTVKDFGDYILLISSSRGSPLNGGSVTRYFPGKFNGTYFEPINNRTDRFFDFGPDNYASQFFFGLPNGAPVVSLGLASNIGYTTSLPAGRELGQTAIFTGPREGYLIHGPSEEDLSYFSRPFDLDSLRGETITSFSAEQLPNRSVSFNSSEAVLVEARFEMQPPDDEVVELDFDFIFRSSKSSKQIICTTIFKTWAADFGCAHSPAISDSSIDNSPLKEMSVREVRPLLPFHNPAVRRWEVQAIMDRSILEVYLNKGVAAGTVTVLPGSSIDAVRFQSSKIPIWATLSVKVQQLRSEQGTLFRFEH